ncbi:hypothetical protein ACO1O0_002210 [Amphichorda felina]
MADDKPPLFNYVLSFILVGLAWGFTTPFIRRAARTHSPPSHPALDDPAIKRSWLKTKLYSAFFSVVDLLRNPRYAIPLLLNLTGSVWFFLLIGQAGESLSLALRQGCVLDYGGWRPAASLDGQKSPCDLMWLTIFSTRTELSLTVPIVNTMAFLFTVMGEWYVEGKVISKDTAVGVALSLTGIALCVRSKQ